MLLILQKNKADSLILLLAVSTAVEVFEASLHGSNLLGQCRSYCRWMPKQAYTEVFIAASMAVDTAESRQASYGEF